MGGCKRETSQNLAACQAVGIDFISLVMESTGGWSENALEFLSKIGSLQA